MTLKSGTYLTLAGSAQLSRAYTVQPSITGEVPSGGTVYVFAAGQLTLTCGEDFDAGTYDITIISNGVTGSLTTSTGIDTHKSEKYVTLADGDKISVYAYTIKLTESE